MNVNTAIYVENITLGQISIEENYFENISFSGLWLNRATNFMIKGDVFSRCFAPIFLNNSFSGEITANFVSESQSFGMWINNITNIDVDDNTASFSETSGVIITNASKISMSNAVVHDSNDYGLFLMNISELELDSSTLFDNNLHLRGYSDMALISSSKVSVRNISTKQSEIGIYIQNT